MPDNINRYSVSSQGIERSRAHPVSSLSRIRIFPFYSRLELDTLWFLVPSILLQHLQRRIFRLNGGKGVKAWKKIFSCNKSLFSTIFRASSLARKMVDSPLVYRVQVWTCKPNLTLNNKPIKLGWNGGSIQRFYPQQLTFSFVYVLAILNLAENIIFIFRVLFRGKSNLNGNWDSRGNYDHTCFLWELRKGNICIIKEITKKFFISNNNLLLLEILIILNNVNRSFDKVNIGELFRRK